MRSPFSVLRSPLRCAWRRPRRQRRLSPLRTRHHQRRRRRRGTRSRWRCPLCPRSTFRLRQQPLTTKSLTGLFVAHLGLGVTVGAGVEGGTAGEGTAGEGCVPAGVSQGVLGAVSGGLLGAVVACCLCVLALVANLLFLLSCLFLSRCGCAVLVCWCVGVGGCVGCLCVCIKFPYVCLF
jgi:hypothetical protein